MKNEHAPAATTKAKRPARALVPTGPTLTDSDRETIMLGANDRPAKTDTPEPPVAPTAPAAKAATKAAAHAKPAKTAAKAPEAVTEAPAAGTEAPAANALPAGPWDQADPHGKEIPFLLRLPPDLHAKMTFLSAHRVPHKAKHPMVIGLLQAQFDLWIRQYYETAPPTRNKVA